MFPWRFAQLSSSMQTAIAPMGQVCSRPYGASSWRRHLWTPTACCRRVGNQFFPWGTVRWSYAVAGMASQVLHGHSLLN